MVDNRYTAVVGIGVTGLSVVRYLAAKGERLIAFDTREAPPCLDQLRTEFPDIPLVTGDWDARLLAGVRQILLSPGLPLSHPALQPALDAGIPLTGDIELFAQAARSPIVAITGSNGKSTVTTLLGEMARNAGQDVGIGGNLGTPALELLQESRALYVIEVSSFQLETTDKLNARAATVLNISPDHMDRYADLSAYQRAKHRVYDGADQIVFNRDDELTRPLQPSGSKMWNFGRGRPGVRGFGQQRWQGRDWLMFEQEPLLPAGEVAMRGGHNLTNALAALALGRAVGLDMAPMIETLKTFSGLPHRCQTVAEINGVLFVNDSKGTNVGATLAALEGLGNGHNNLVLIAGGQGKGADFSLLGEAVAKHVKHVILIGEDARRIAAALSEASVQFAEDLRSAVAAARRCAEEGETVLLSPACASFDQFRGFEDRGEQFVAAVREGASK